MFSRALGLLARPFVTQEERPPSNTAPTSNHVTIMEVGPRDGLQNENPSISVQTKVELINRLALAGIKCIEAGSFVSPKWVPQMAETADVITRMDHPPDVRYSVLVPNLKGLNNLVETVAKSSSTVSSAEEVAVFTAASEAFSHANTNCSIAESIERARQVTEAALQKGFKVRGYIGTVIECPYSGKADYGKVRDIAKELVEMGCYEVSLADTTGMGNPHSVAEMIRTVLLAVPADKLAGHFHDTFGMGVANVMTALSLGIRTIDTSIAGLGGCPYSPGATGNVATEDVIYALRDSQYTVSGDLDALVDVGNWISNQIGKPNSSRVGAALYAKKKREHESPSRKL